MHLDHASFSLSLSIILSLFRLFLSLNLFIYITQKSSKNKCYTTWIKKNRNARNHFHENPIKQQRLAREPVYKIYLMRKKINKQTKNIIRLLKVYTRFVSSNTNYAVATSWTLDDLNVKKTQLNIKKIKEKLLILKLSFTEVQKNFR